MNKLAITPISPVPNLSKPLAAIAATIIRGDGIQNGAQTLAKGNQEHVDPGHFDTPAGLVGFNRLGKFDSSQQKKYKVNLLAQRFPSVCEIIAPSKSLS
jgi:hypothetical protein